MSDSSFTTHEPAGDSEHSEAASASVAADETGTALRDDAAAEGSANAGDGAGEAPAEELPPVEPPSAGFIMQLFLVPGLIVAAVIAVWALFGQLSASEQDWRQLVAELRSNNEHRRWRGATGLAQMLRADVEMGESGRQLSSQPQVARELVSLLNELLKQPAQDEELTSQQSFLIRTLGWMDVNGEVIPVLLTATEPRHETIVRSDAIRSLARIAGRADDRGEPLDGSEVTASLLEVSRDSDPLIRQVSAFTLGLIPGQNVDQRLRVLAEDRDANTRINASLAMARREMPAAVPALLSLLETAAAPVDPDSVAGETEMEKLVNARSQASMNQVVLGNSLKAVRDLAGELTSDQRAEAVSLCRRLTQEADNMRIRVEAEETLQKLEGSE